MNKYDPKATKTIEQTVKKYNKGKLTFAGDKQVKSRQQAVAIGVSEARKKGYKVPAPTK